MSLPPLLARVAGGAVSGFLLLLAFPPVDQRWVAVVALVPLLLALRGASWRQGLLTGVAFGLSFFGILLSWISLFGFVAWTALVVTMTAHVGLFGAVAAPVMRLGTAGRIAGAPLIWAGVEMARGRFPLGGFTWGGLGYSQHSGGSLLPVARLGGVILLGAVIVAVNALLAEAIARAPRRVPYGFAAVALVLAPALLPVGAAGAQTGSIDVAVVQGNVSRDTFTGIGRDGMTEDRVRVIVQNHLDVTAQIDHADPPDLVVWPENSVDRDPRADPSLLRSIQAQVQRLGTRFLVGAILDDGDRWRNANLLFSPEGEIAGRYDKTHLVPFGEYVPWRFARRLVPALDEEIPVDGVAGEELVTFDLPPARVTSVICYESIFPHLVRDAVRGGGQVLVVTTNNTSYGTSPASAQHLAMSSVRAVEHGLPVVHAAISGISALIRPSGEVIDRVELFTQGLLRADLPVSEGRTPYTRYGAGIELALGIGAAAVVVAAAIRSRREEEVA